MESVIYTVNGKEFELKHYGVKGMKWGRRKARPEVSGIPRGGARAAGTSTQSDAARKEARKQKAKRAAVIGAAAVGTALAAYGAYKVSRYVKNTKAIKSLEAFRDQDLFNAQRRGDNRNEIIRIDNHYYDKISALQKNRWK